MVLWGIPFVLVGLYLIIGRFFADAYLRARTCYGVTDQRVLIVTNLWNLQVKSVSLRTLGDISLREVATIPSDHLACRPRRIPSSRGGVAE
jgi:hypothetical protein